MTAPVDRPEDFCYFATGGFGEGSVFVEDRRGETKLLPHIVKHSPTGFAWGYGGSGPAELARCILIHFYGDQARCPECQGQARICSECDQPPDPNQSEPRCPATGAEHVYGSCYQCDGGYRLPIRYQDFKSQAIAGLDQREPWQLRGTKLAEWIRTWQERNPPPRAYGLPSQAELDEVERRAEESAL